MVKWTDFSTKGWGPGTYIGVGAFFTDDPSEDYIRNDDSSRALSTLIVGSGNIFSNNPLWNELKEVSAGLGKLAKLEVAKASGDISCPRDRVARTFYSCLSKNLSKNFFKSSALSIPVTV